MSTAQRYIPPLLTAFIGVATGVYVFDPILKQYKEDTHGTFKPQDVDTLKVTERTKQEAKEQEERIQAFKKHVEVASGKGKEEAQHLSSAASAEVKKDVESLQNKVKEVETLAQQKTKSLVEQSKALVQAEDKEKSSTGSWWPFSRQQ